jgi:PAS domain-containing protein
VTSVRDGAATPRQDRTTALGDFLRGRRTRTDPDAVHLLVDRRRRQVAGLRREELADLAGISADYYTRLEQGRERSPSTQVLDALARALRLDDDEAGHLFRLAGRAASRSSGAGPDAVVGDDLRALLDPSSVRIPVAVLDQAMDVVALNPVGAAFYGGFARADNLLRMIFRDPAARRFYEEWELTARATVAMLRASSAQFPGDPGIAAVVAELGTGADFARCWSEQEVGPSPCPTTHRIHHPLVGDLDLYCTTVAVVSVPGQYLHVFTPEPGGETAERLERLAPGG